MGFYKVHCKKCDETWEVMCNHEQLEELCCGDKDYWGRPMMFDPNNPDKVNTEGCGNVVERIWEPMTFHIAAKGMDTHGVDSVNGHYSHAFGRHFRNEYHKHEWAEANGWKEVSESEADAALGQQYENLKKQDETSKTWQENLKAAGGDKIQAAAKTFVPKNMQDK
jgi:hypothetical protein